MSFDVEELRKKLIDYYTAGAFTGFGGMFYEVEDIKEASDDEIIRRAKAEKMI